MTARGPHGLAKRGRSRLQDNDTQHTTDLARQGHHPNVLRPDIRILAGNSLAALQPCAAQVLADNGEHGIDETLGQCRREGEGVDMDSSS